MKYEEFLYMGICHPVSDYWNGFRANRKATEEKYDGKMFCPNCGKAPLTAATGSTLQYLKVDKADMHKHDPNCVLLLESLRKRDSEKLLTDTKRFMDVKNCLEGCMNKMLNANRQTSSDGTVIASQVRQPSQLEYLKINDDSKRKRRINQKKLTTKFHDDDLDYVKLFYGIVHLSTKVAKDKRGREMAFLEIWNPENDEKICTLVFFASAYKWMALDIATISRAGRDEKYCICFVNKMDADRKATFNDSRFFRFEKARLS